MENTSKILRSQGDKSTDRHNVDKLIYFIDHTHIKSAGGKASERLDLISCRTY